MNKSLVIVGLTSALLVAGWVPLEAQRYPLAPRVGFGDNMHPFFEGWYELEDGSKVFSFGYFNRNLGDNIVNIPRGEDNFVEPAELDGMQPEWFPVRRERGVFVVRVPSDWPIDRDVTWTFRSQGELYSVPASFRTDALQLSTGPAAMGSDRPFLKMDEDGEEGTGIVDPVWVEPRSARVGEPLGVTIWARDHTVEGAAREELVPIQAVMWVHHGPANAVIVAQQQDDQSELEEAGPDSDGDESRPNVVTIPVESADGSAEFSITFSEPGSYLMRVMVENHRAIDSSQGNQCCWTNGYVEVEVSR